MSKLTPQQKEEVRKCRQEAERKLAASGMNPVWAKILSWLVAALLAGALGWLAGCNGTLCWELPADDAGRPHLEELIQQTQQPAQEEA